LQVDREFIEDNFNLYGLRALVPHYNEALDVILDIERMGDAPNEEKKVSLTMSQVIVYLMLTLFVQVKIQSSAEYLYGLIHARFVLTNDGLNAVLEKFYKADYGRCPRTHCMDQPVLPAAASDNPNEDAVKVIISGHPELIVWGTATFANWSVLFCHHRCKRFKIAY
jgi:casein kinase II subunit beta